MSEITLKVGDVLYKTSYGKLIGRATIEKVDKSFAYIVGNKFKINQMGAFRSVGAGKYDSVFWHPETQELKEAFFKAQYKSKIDKIWAEKANELDCKQLIKILSILQEKTTIL